MSNSRRKASKRAADRPRRDFKAKTGERGGKAAPAPLKADGKTEIRVTCKANSIIALDEISSLQGDLKTLTGENFDKLKNAILKHGISFPIFLWRNKNKAWIIDGTQREKVLQKMREEGYKIPPLPVDWIDAKDEKEAKEKILLATSQYGEMNNYTLAGFLEENDLSFPDLTNLINLPQINIEYFRDPNFEPGSEDEQGRLDQKKPITCPECGAEFTPK